MEQWVQLVLKACKVFKVCKVQLVQPEPLVPQVQLELVSQDQQVQSVLQVLLAQME